MTVKIPNELKELKLLKEKLYYLEKDNFQIKLFIKILNSKLRNLK